MLKFESVMIINPNADEETITAVIKGVTDIINETGNLESIEKLGKKKLAYEIKKNKEGYYVSINFEGDIVLSANVESYYKGTNEIIKFIVFRKDGLNFKI